MPENPLRRFNPPTVAPPVSRYSHGTVHPLGNGLKRLVCAGQVGITPDGKVAEGLKAQVEQAWDNLLAVIAAEGLGPEHIVKLTAFVADPSPDAVNIVREVRTRKLGELAPSSTYLVVAGLASPALKFEVEAEAVGPA
jgi:enamine deaminase RidA (YjgF/YER057c/UK114 family)